jgi:predicted aspartyl protease
MSVRRYPSLSFRLTIAGTSLDGSALVDSGFEGYVALPKDLERTLSAPAYHWRVETASGELVDVPVWDGTAELTDAPGSFQVRAIALGDEFLVGLRLMNRFRITFDHGRQLLVEP